MGLSKEDLLKMTWREFDSTFEGYSEKAHADWSRTRTIVSMLYNSNVKKGKQKKPIDIMPLPMDEVMEQRRPPKKYNNSRWVYLKKKWAKKPVKKETVRHASQIKPNGK